MTMVIPPRVKKGILRGGYHFTAAPVVAVVLVVAVAEAVEEGVDGELPYALHHPRRSSCPTAPQDHTPPLESRANAWLGPADTDVM